MKYFILKTTQLKVTCDVEICRVNSKQALYKEFEKLFKKYKEENKFESRCGFYMWTIENGERYYIKAVNSKCNVPKYDAYEIKKD